MDTNKPQTWILLPPGISSDLGTTGQPSQRLRSAIISQLACFVSQCGMRSGWKLHRRTRPAQAGQGWGPAGDSGRRYHTTSFQPSSRRPVVIIMPAPKELTDLEVCERCSALSSEQKQRVSQKIFHCLTGTFSFVATHTLTLCMSGRVDWDRKLPRQAQS